MSAIRDNGAANQRAAKARAAILRDWLRSHGAACLWQQVIPRVGMMESWEANGRVFMLLHYRDGDGFELFIPASVSNRTDETLAAASRYIRGES